MCGDGWDANDAAVACRQLGLPSQCKHILGGVWASKLWVPLLWGPCIPPKFFFIVKAAAYPGLREGRCTLRLAARYAG